jgi:hypothetical protein
LASKSFCLYLADALDLGLDSDLVEGPPEELSLDGEAAEGDGGGGGHVQLLKGGPEVVLLLAADLEIGLRI